MDTDIQTLNKRADRAYPVPGMAMVRGERGADLGLAAALASAAYQIK